MLPLEVAPLESDSINLFDLLLHASLSLLSRYHVYYPGRPATPLHYTPLFILQRRYMEWIRLAFCGVLFVAFESSVVSLMVYTVVHYTSWSFTININDSETHRAHSSMCSLAATLQGYSHTIMLVELRAVASCGA